MITHVHCHYTVRNTPNTIIAHNRWCTIPSLYYIVVWYYVKNRGSAPHVMNNGNGTLCCNMNQNHECCLYNHLVGLLMGMRLCVAGLECVLGMRLCVARLEWVLLLRVYYDNIMARHACMHEGVLSTQSGSDLAVNTKSSSSSEGVY